MAKNTRPAKKRGRVLVVHAFPPAGTTLVGGHHGEEHRATIVEWDGRLLVKVGRETDRSPERGGAGDHGQRGQRLAVLDSGLRRHDRRPAGRSC